MIADRADTEIVTVTRPNPLVPLTPIQRAKNLLRPSKGGPKSESLRALELRLFANRSLEDAAQLCYEWMMDEEQDKELRFKCMQLIIERRLGKPRMAVDVKQDTEMTVKFEYVKRGTIVQPSKVVELPDDPTVVDAEIVED